MREGWEVKKLGDVCELIKRGIAPKYTEDRDNSLCVINQKCIRDHKINLSLSRLHDKNIKAVNPERLISIGDVLINSTGTGTLGRVAQVREIFSHDCTVDTHVTIVRPIPNLFYNDFFGYALIKIEEEITQSGEGASGQTELPRNKLENNFYISYPTSLPEQTQIVTTLDKAFKQIDQAKVNLEKNLHNAKELFQSKLNEVFSQRGEGWEEKRLGDVCDGFQYGSSSKSEMEGDIPVLRMGNIQNGKIDWTNLKYSSNEEDNKKFLLKDGDVLFNRTNSPEHVGKSALYEEERATIFAGYIIRLRGKNKILNNTFLNFYLNSYKTRKYGYSIMSSSVNQANINASKLKKYVIRFPSFEIQNSLAIELKSLVIEIEKLKNNYQQKLNNLEELKKSILQKAFRGEL